MNAPQKVYDRTAEDVGNIVLLEHVNLRQDDQRLATLFYVGGLGLTRDPFLHVIDVNMWFNCGRQQFHMPQRLRGLVGMVQPDLDALVARLEAMKPKLEGTRYEFARSGDAVEATCPWGNRFRIHAPGPRFGGMRLGIPYVELTVPKGTAAAIVRFYQKVMLWESLEAIRAFAGPNYEVAVIPEERRRFLSHFDDRSAHYEVISHP